MLKRHIDLESLLALLYQQTGHEAIQVHVRHCEMCAQVLGEFRLLDVMLDWSPGLPIGDHPDDESMAAYAEEALSPKDMRLIARHLAGCEPCLTSLIELRASLHQTDDDSREPTLRDSLFGQLAAAGWRSQGRLLIAATDDPPKILSARSPSDVSRWAPRPAAVTLGFLRAAHARVGLQATPGGELFRLVDGAGSPHLSDFDYSSPKREPPDPRFDLPVGPWRVCFGVRRTGADLYLTVCIKDGFGSGEGGERVEYWTSKWDYAVTTTDDTGSVDIAIGGDGGQLEIGPPPAWRFQIVILGRIAL